MTKEEWKAAILSAVELAHAGEDGPLETIAEGLADAERLAQEVRDLGRDVLGKDV
jgi:hypothetical protein